MVILLALPGICHLSKVQGSNNNLDKRSDIFSLGVVLYQLFSGQKPFKASSVVETHQKTLHYQPKKISHFLPSFPKDLQTIISKCLNKQAKNRYQSILELKHDLENWLNGFPINAKKDNVVAIIYTLIKRNKLATLLLATILTIGITSFAKYTYDIKYERQIAVQAKEESDDLLNFLLTDLNQELTEIGRIDLLKPVAEESLQHLKKFDQNLTTIKGINHAKSYRNIAGVLAMQEDLSGAEDAFNSSNAILNKLVNDSATQSQALSLLALSHSDLANLQSKKGQIQLANKSHEKSIQYAEKLEAIDAGFSASTLSTVYLSYGWNLMETSKHDQALVMLNKALDVINQQLIKNNTSTQWLIKKQRTLTAFGWLILT